MRLALAVASISASTDATGCPQRSTTRENFCGSIRHIPEVTLLLAIPLLSRRGSFYTSYRLFSWMSGNPSRLLRFLPVNEKGTLLKPCVWSAPRQSNPLLADTISEDYFAKNTAQSYLTLPVAFASASAKIPRSLPRGVFTCQCKSVWERP